MKTSKSITSTLFSGFIALSMGILSANAIKKYQQNYSQEKFIQNLESILKG